MSIRNTGNRQARPTHPREMLREDFLPDYRLTISGLAGAVGNRQPGGAGTNVDARVCSSAMAPVQKGGTVAVTGAAGFIDPRGMRTVAYSAAVRHHLLDLLDIRI